MNRPRIEVRWHRRLSVRAAALITLVLLVFDQVSGELDAALGGLLGLRLGRVLMQIEVDDRRDGLVELPTAVTVPALAMIDDPRADAEAGPALQKALQGWLHAADHSYVLTDTRLSVVSASAGSAVVVGARLPLPALPRGRVERWPVLRAGVLLGWLHLSFPPTSEAVAESGKSLLTESRVVTPAQGELLAEREWWVTMAVEWGLRFGAAATVALFVSWLVTRRVVRLADAVGFDPRGGDGLPAASRRGSDEIAALAVALDEARGRVRGLIQELAARDTARREWIAQVSHDIRTPLTALIACLERAVPIVDRRASSRSADDASLREIIDVARSDADRVAQLTRDLLDAATLDLPHQLVLEPVLPGELLERVSQQLAPLANKRGLALSVQVGPGVSTVSGDGRRLLRVLENLLRNAIEHARTVVELRVLQVGDGVAIEVVDDGCGLAAAATGGDRRRADSAGLGLQVARRILASHGSELDLADRPEGGCRSRFVLPCSRE